jgi:HK97 family phage major capsid protein
MTAKTIKALADKRATIKRELRNLIDSVPSSRWTISNQRTYDHGVAELDRLDDQIVAARADVFRTSAHDTDDRVVLRSYLLNGFAGFTAEQVAHIRNTMSTTTGSQGGYTVATDVSARIADLMKDYSGVRRVAEVIVTAKGNAMPWPTSDGTTETGELLAENASASEADPTFGTAPLTAWKYSSKVITVPFELLQDSGIDFEGVIADRVASRIGRSSNTHFTTGSGSSQPNGFVTAASTGKTGTTGQTTSIIHDDVIDLVHSVNGEYRQETHGAQFMTSDAGFKMLRKLKDTAGRPIYLPSDGEGPESVMGYDVVINNDIAAPAASAKSLYFGNWWRGYKVRDALDVTIFRLADSVYATKGQVGFIAFSRCGGNLVDTAAVKAYQHSAS